MIRGSTVVLWAIPILFLGSALRVPDGGPVGILGLFLVAIYAHVWFWWRPHGFEVTDSELIVRFPWRTKRIPRDRILGCAIMTSDQLQARFGRTYRVGAGGLWGGFGWLVSSKREWIEFYISRQTDFLLLERKDDIPLLITPAQTADMLAALTGPGPGA
jgi:hypothetical protein